MSEKCQINGTMLTPCRFLKATANHKKKAIRGLFLEEPTVANIDTLKDYKRTKVYIRSGEYPNGVGILFCPACGTDFKPMYEAIKQASAEAAEPDVEVTHGK